MNKYEDKAISLLNEFCLSEFGDKLEEVDLKDKTRVQIMFTEYEKGEVEELNEHLKVEVFVNLKEFKIWVEYNDIQVYEENYDEKEFLKLLESLDFDSYTNLDELEKYFELKEMN